MTARKKPTGRSVASKAANPFSLAILVGRFQPLHKGHQLMIDAALKTADRVGIMIGSSQEQGTAKNPFSYEEREKMLRSVYGDRIMICPLPDIGVGNTYAWGRYVSESCERSFGERPSLLVTGCEERRTSWFEPSLGIFELCIPKTIDISASSIRKALADGDKAAFEQYAPKELIPFFGEYRTRILETQSNTQSQSI